MVSFIAYFNIFQEVIKYDNIIAWIKSKRALDRDQVEELRKDLFPGLRLVIVSLWTGLIQSLNDEEVFDLVYDKYYIRLFHYVEMKLNQIPITCERTAFIIGLMNLGKNLRRAKNYRELDVGIELVKPFLNDLREIIDSQIDFSGIDKNLAMKILNIYTLFTDFHNCDKSFPRCLRYTLSDIDVTPEYMLKCYYGFFCVVNYLWIKILDKKELKIINLKELYLLPELIKSVLKSKKKLFLFLKSVIEFINQESNENKDFYMDNGSIIIEGKIIFNNFTNQISQLFKFKQFKIYKYLRNSNEFFRKLGNLMELKGSFRILQGVINPHIHLFINIMWDIFDNFYPIISKFIDDKKYQELIPYISPYDKIFLRNKQSKNIVKKYLANISDISHPSSNQKKDIFNFLDLKFLWYELDVLEAHRSFFNGFAACKSIILGEIYNRMSYDIKEKLFVKIFRHSGGTTGSITFAILVEGYGNVSSDFSGWLIFYNSASYGYSGFGPNLYKYILNILNENKKHINCEQITIKSDIFLEYLGGHQVERSLQEFNFMNSLTKENESLKYKIEQHNGIIFESLVYKWLNINKKYQIVNWNENIRGNQIDLMVFYKNIKKIDLIECKLNLHLDSLQKIKRNILTKQKVIANEFKLYQIDCVLIVFNKVVEERKKDFESKQIRVIDNFKEIISRNRKLFGKNTLTDYFINI